MRFRILTGMTLAAVVAAPAAAEEIYRWRDESGQLHYSDMPRDGAEQIELDPAQTFQVPPPKSSPRRQESSSEQQPEPEPGYESLEIVSPFEEENIWNTGGVITVSIRPQPGLKPDHRLNLYYDGQMVEGMDPRQTSVQLSEVYRGEHILRAEVLDSGGTVLISSGPRKFYYKQSTVKLP